MAPRFLAFIAAGFCVAALAQQQPVAPGAAPAAAATIPAPITQPAPPSQWTPAQATAAFQRADIDGDGVLSRAEAQHLPLLPRPFEDLDSNKDGLLSLDEYLSGFPH